MNRVHQPRPLVVLGLNVGAGRLITTLLSAVRLKLIKWEADYLGGR